ncbi:calcium and integrin-binding protein 1-like isoform X2 [Chrysoperla carnea]|uniref:calcium and integrin-binding protein 1-like isoform X2 n=1 Tax=Chrysoperla carnea TaxID=189513 RepID=UPI001D05E541|nr:calcium and integrin-binding protein 1-like isoform X2 [Chrysoperla carnea]
MGSEISKSSLTNDIIDDYVELTYLTKVEIIQIYKKFRSINETEVDNDIQYRIRFSSVQEVFPELKHNPFSDRLCSVFSSKKDNHFSFEDLLDLYSVFSKTCPDKVKAAWAFQVYDFNEDMQICKEDISEAITRLAKHRDRRKVLDDDEIDHISNVTVFLRMRVKQTKFNKSRPQNDIFPQKIFC